MSSAPLEIRAYFISHPLEEIKPLELAKKLNLNHDAVRERWLVWIRRIRVRSCQREKGATAQYSVRSQDEKKRIENGRNWRS